MRIYTRLLPLFIAVAGCGGSGGSGIDMAIMATCSQMSMDQSPYTGAAAGALALATGPIKAWYSDAYLYDLRGGQVGFKGNTTAGMNGGQWVVSYYSPTAKRSFAGAYSGTSGHVGCQDLNIAKIPNVQPDPPKQKSGDVIAEAISRITLATAPNPPELPMSMKANNVEYGQVTIGILPPHDKAWSVDLSPGLVVVDDETGMAIECMYNGQACP